ncbi:MAG: 3'-5' DNA helicase [Peltula sp. TS41687]|nr:MAG: 3'-5' DNA helicase [Peltula sp. TS41687]
MSEMVDEDEFGDAGWIDDDDLMLAANRVENAALRASKRRRLNSDSTEIVTASKDNRIALPEGDDVFNSRAPLRPQANSNRVTKSPVDGKARQGTISAPKTAFNASSFTTQPPVASSSARTAQWTALGFGQRPRSQTSEKTMNSRARDTLSTRNKWSGSSSRNNGVPPSRLGVSGSDSRNVFGSSRQTSSSQQTPFARSSLPSASALHISKSSGPTVIDLDGQGSSADQANILGELEGLPSDAFSLSSSPTRLQHHPSHLSSSFLSRQKSTASAGNLRQTTLLGARVHGSAVQEQEAQLRVQPDTRPEEPATQHKLDHDAFKTWVYPTNLGAIRDYQYNIVQKGLYNNLLVALPTGLGKTFIAATIMLNWFRWTKDSQIVFVAPTKPLVAQQVEACFGIVGIPRSQTTLLTGAIPPGLRAEEWSSKRVFFMTPQTLINDLKTGICDPKRIVCIVVDEAHRAKGSYAYVEVIRFIRRFNQSFRVLALTATPGSSVESVQEVIDGLDISRVEIRTEESLDIRQYVHSRKVDIVVFDPSEEICKLRELFSKALQPILDQLNQANACWIRDPMSLTAFGLTQAKQQWMSSDAGRNADNAFKGKMFTIFAVLASLAHSITLLNIHGIGPFYQYLAGFRGEVESGESSGKYRKQVTNSPHFQSMMDQARRLVNDSDFVGHPKLVYLRQVVLNHFLDAGDGRGTTDGISPSHTRIMIFVQYRDSADDIVRILEKNQPMVRPHVFVGQSAAKNSAGMDQKKQLKVIQDFQKGIYNTLVATCVGEEGLDIGEVDLIICCDSSSSPIRMLQRMGRTGRKRAGNIVLLLMRGKEEESYTKAKDAYQKMQQLIADGGRFTFHDDLSPRILPKDVKPVVDKRMIQIPLENSQQTGLPEPKKRGKVPKRPPKKFHMPDGVRTGFVKASRLRDGDPGEAASDDDDDEVVCAPELSEGGVVAIPAVDAVLLTPAEERDLNRRYQYVYGGDEAQTVEMPRLDAQPAYQRTLGETKYLPHGRASVRMVKLLNVMHNIDQDDLDRLRTSLHPDDRDPNTSKRHRSLSVISDGEVSTEEAPRRARRSSSSAAESLTNDGDSDDGLDDFIVPNDVVEMIDDDDSLPTTQSSVEKATTPFYTSPKKKSSQSSDPEEDLPDVSLLVRKSGGTDAPARSKAGQGVKGS